MAETDFGCDRDTEEATGDVALVMRHRFALCGLHGPATSARVWFKEFDFGMKAGAAVEYKLLQSLRWRETKESVSVPATWWGALRARFWPAWALARWPVRCRMIPTEIHEYHVCPHIPLPGESGVVHLAFLRHPRLDVGPEKE